MSVLHTWGQNLSHHPHIHCVVAGGAWDAQRKAFIKAPNPRFLFSVRAMSKVFRGKMLDDLRKHGLPGVNDDMLTRILSKAATAEWMVYAKPPSGGPRQVLRYLARSVHRVALPTWPAFDFVEGSVSIVGPQRPEASSFQKPLRWIEDPEQNRSVDGRVPIVLIFRVFDRSGPSGSGVASERSS